MFKDLFQIRLASKFRRTTLHVSSSVVFDVYYTCDCKRYVGSHLHLSITFKLKGVFKDPTNINGPLLPLVDATSVPLATFTKGKALSNRPEYIP